MSRKMKHNLKNRPKYEELDDIGGMENHGVQFWGLKVEKWFEGFEKELQQRKKEARETGNINWIEIEEILGENQQ